MTTTIEQPRPSKPRREDDAARLGPNSSEEMRTSTARTDPSADAPQRTAEALATGADRRMLGPNRRKWGRAVENHQTPGLWSTTRTFQDCARVGMLSRPLRRQPQRLCPESDTLVAEVSRTAHDRCLGRARGSRRRGSREEGFHGRLRSRSSATAIFSGAVGLKPRPHLRGEVNLWRQ